MAIITLKRRLREAPDMAPGKFTIEWLSDSEEALWEEFVHAHPLGTVCQTTGWKRAIESTLGHIRGRPLVLRDASGAVLAGTMVYTVRSWLLGNRLVSVPFGSRVDPLVSSTEQLGAIFNYLNQYRREVDARRLQLRLSRAESAAQGADYCVVRILKRHYLPLENGTSPLWAKLDPSLRRRIRKAERDGVEIRKGGGPRDWDDFFRLCGATRQRARMPILPKRFFVALSEFLEPEEWQLLIASYQGRAVGAGLLLSFNGVCQGEWAGDSVEGRRVNANQKLYWTAIEDAAVRGCHTFCFGRTDITNEGLLQYKRTWGCIEEEMPFITTDAPPGSIQRRADSNFARNFARRIIGSAPWYVYLGFSEFCFRHLG